MIKVIKKILKSLLSEIPNMLSFCFWFLTFLFSLAFIVTSVRKFELLSKGKEEFISTLFGVICVTLILNIPHLKISKAIIRFFYDCFSYTFNRFKWYRKLRGGQWFLCYKERYLKEFPLFRWFHNKPKLKTEVKEEITYPTYKERKTIKKKFSKYEFINKKERKFLWLFKV